MSSHLPPPPHSRVRDLFAVLLMLVGGTGLAFAAFTWDVRAGIAVVSAYAITIGILLGTDRATTTVVDYDSTRGLRL